MLTICRTDFGHTQHGKDPVYRDQIRLKAILLSFVG